jgi:hypothetical protein
VGLKGLEMMNESIRLREKVRCREASHGSWSDEAVTVCPFDKEVEKRFLEVLIALEKKLALDTTFLASKRRELERISGLKYSQSFYFEDSFEQ